MGSRSHTAHILSPYPLSTPTRPAVQEQAPPSSIFSGSVQFSVSCAALRPLKPPRWMAGRRAGRRRSCGSYFGPCGYITTGFTPKYLGEVMEGLQAELRKRFECGITSRLLKARLKFSPARRGHVFTYISRDPPKSPAMLLHYTSLLSVLLIMYRETNHGNNSQDATNISTQETMPREVPPDTSSSQCLIQARRLLTEIPLIGTALALPRPSS